jgi:hypothetical protein
MTAKLVVCGFVDCNHFAAAGVHHAFKPAKLGARGDRHKVPPKLEWPEYTTARPFSGKIRGDDVKS